MLASKFQYVLFVSLCYIYYVIDLSLIGSYTLPPHPYPLTQPRLHHNVNLTLNSAHQVTNSTVLVRMIVVNGSRTL